MVSSADTSPRAEPVYGSDAPSGPTQENSTSLFCWQGSQAVEVSAELKPLVARRHTSAHSATFQAASSDISSPASGTVSPAKLQLLSAMFQWMYPASLRFIAAVHEKTRHVLSTARVALDCHGVRLTDRDGDFNHEELLMIGLIHRRTKRVEVNWWHIQCPRPTRINCDKRPLCHCRRFVHHDEWQASVHILATMVCRCTLSANEHHVPHARGSASNCRTSRHALLL